MVGNRPAGYSEGFRRFRGAVTASRDERVAIGGMQLSGSARAAIAAAPWSSHPVRHGDRLAEMGDRLLEGRAAQRLVARLAPPFDAEIVEPGFVK